MKSITSILLLFAISVCHSAMAQETSSTSPRIENYPKGELDLKITSFGEKDPITVGKIAADGTIHFSWPEIDLEEMKENDYYERSISSLLKGKSCKDNAVITNEQAKLVETKIVNIIKYDRLVGCIIPSTQKGQEHNDRQLGSTLYWVYSDSETSVQATCSAKMEWEDLYSFDETTAYDLTFKKGWNMVSNTLSAVEEYDNEGRKNSLPKTISIQTIEQIPSDMHWFFKYWANDELLDLEQKILSNSPTTKEQFTKWLPSALGNLKRTGFELGKELERMPSTNNVNLLFENGSQKVDLTIVDCSGNKDATGMYTLMQDMASRDWKDKTETGYQSASAMDDIRVMIDYNETESKTGLSYNALDRFAIKVEASGMEPYELWEYLKTLNLEALMED